MGGRRRSHDMHQSAQWLGRRCDQLTLRLERRACVLGRGGAEITDTTAEITAEVAHPRARASPLVVQICHVSQREHGLTIVVE